MTSAFRTTPRRLPAAWPALPLVLAAVLAADPAAGANGAWHTFIRTVDCTDVIALDDEIWVASAAGGLLRFDRAGSRFEVTRREPGAIASNRLTRLAFDRSRQLWVGTADRGVSRRSPDGLTWGLINVFDGLSSDSVITLEPQGDTLWIGTRRGIALWNGREVAGALPDGVTISFDTTFTLPAITGVAVMGDSLLLATPRGVGVARISALLRDWRPASQGLPTLDVEAVASDGADVFALAGAEVHRFRLDLGSWESAGIQGPVFELADHGGEVLAASAAGIFVWRTTPVPGWVQVGDPLLPGPSGAGPVIAGDPLGGVVAARAETLYVQSVVLPSGPRRSAAVAAWQPQVAPDGPTTNNLVSVVIEGPRVYSSTFFDGMGRYDGNAWQHWREVCSGTCDTTLVRGMGAFGLMVDREGHKWVGSWSPRPDAGFVPGGTLTEIDDSVSPPQFIHRVRVNDISELELQQRTWMLLGVTDARGRRWFATDTPAAGDIDPIGLVHYDSAGAFVQSLNPSNSNMSGLFIRGLGITPTNGRIWLAYDDNRGLDYFNFNPPTPITFQHIASTNGRSLRGLATYGDSVWTVAPEQSQLIRFSQGSIPTSGPSTVGMICPQDDFAVRPLAVAPDGRLWVATSAGLKTLAFGAARPDSFTTLNSPLPDDVVRSVAVEPATGAVWITTTGGLARFDPGYVAPPPPLLPSLRIRVYPNPASLTNLGIALRLTGEGETYSGSIHDLSGRRLRSFSGVANGGVVWDGRDAHGHPAKPGIYFVRAEAGGRVSVARVALFR